MKQHILLFIVTLTVTASGMCQGSAIDGILDYPKGGSKHSSVIELPYAPNVVEEAIDESMGKKGYKPQKIKGDIRVYRGVILENDTEPSDLHFKIERKSRQEKEVAKVYLIVARLNENVAERASGEMHKSELAKIYLNGIGIVAAAHSLDLNIRDQESNVTSAQKRMKNLKDDQDTYQDKINKLQDRLDQNKKDQLAQMQEMTKQQGILDALNARKLAAVKN